MDLPSINELIDRSLEKYLLSKNIDLMDYNRFENEFKSINVELGGRNPSYEPEKDWFILSKRRIFRSFDEMIVFVKDSIGKYKHYSIREITHTGTYMGWF